MIYIVTGFFLSLTRASLTEVPEVSTVINYSALPALPASAHPPQDLPFVSEQ